VAVTDLIAASPIPVKHIGRAGDYSSGFARAISLSLDSRVVALSHGATRVRSISPPRPYPKDTLIVRFSGDVLMPDVRQLIAQCPRKDAPGAACPRVFRRSAQREPLIELSSPPKASRSLVRRFCPRTGDARVAVGVYAEGHAACGYLSESATAFPD
jgi:hypothetical protein